MREEHLRIKKLCAQLAFAIIIGHAWSSSAKAYTSGGTFLTPISGAAQGGQGGGGGRWFTGSIRDGYTCAVCHQGGVPPLVQFTGEPAGDIYAPGQMYTFDFVWPAEQSTLAAAIEFYDQSGNGAGEVLVEPPSSMEENCTNPAQLAALRYEAADNRRIIYMQRCGNTRGTLRRCHRQAWQGQPPA